MDFIDLKTQYKKLKKEIDTGIEGVLNHGQYIMGPEISVLEKKLSQFVNAKYCLTCSSGTDALLMALIAMDVKPGDYVLTTPFTFIATAEVISLLGAIPDFVDIDKTTFNIDINQVNQKLKNNPNKYKAILPVNIFGLLADYKGLNDLKNKYDIKIIEDAAQSFGASFDNKISCSFGDISCTSFFPAKPLGCYGDGGAVFTDNNKYLDILKSIRIHGKGQDKYNNVRLGINGRLDTIQAAILIPKLKILNDEIKLRNKVANLYNTHISSSFIKHHIPSGNVSAWAQYSILCNSSSHREAIIDGLKHNNIPSAIYYPIPLHLQKVFECLEFKYGDFPISEDIASKILSLPMHPYLEKHDIKKICKVINEI
tara:strand:+ start:78 stop:1184 length:1107 start_codon:yes stop_codon:yes gene_type:complete